MIHLEIRAEQALRDIGDAAGRVLNLRPAHEAGAMQLRGGILRNFRAEGHFPQPWRKSRAAADRGGQTLAASGTLRSSIHTTVTDSYGAAGTDVLYAAIHHFGGRTGRNHATVLPARPILPVDDNGEMEPRMAARIRAIYRRYIVEGRA